MYELIKVEDEKFEQIFYDIKDRYLSQANFPKLLIGS